MNNIHSAVEALVFNGINANALINASLYCWNCR